MTVGSLFAGIGGFDLGFERAGMKTLWQVEINEFCRRVLEKNFPEAQRHADIRECGRHNLSSVDVISGGFPCQDVSVAGAQRGLRDGTRSGLWSELHRIVGELRPRYVVVENVANLLAGPPQRAGAWFSRVLADMAAIGYDAEWECLSAAAFGADHLRPRVFLLAYPAEHGRARILQSLPRISAQEKRTAADALDPRRARIRQVEARICEPAILGSIDGISFAVEQLAAYGNAVYPAIAEWIGGTLMATEARARSFVAKQI